MLKLDPALSHLAGKGYEVWWEDEGAARKLLVRSLSTNASVARPLPTNRTYYDEETGSRRPAPITTEEIVFTIAKLVKHLKALEG